MPRIASPPLAPLRPPFPFFATAHPSLVWFIPTTFTDRAKQARLHKFAWLLQTPRRLNRRSRLIPPAAFLLAYSLAHRLPMLTTAMPTLSAVSDGIRRAPRQKTNAKALPPKANPLNANPRPLAARWANLVGLLASLLVIPSLLCNSPANAQPARPTAAPISPSSAPAASASDSQTKEPALETLYLPAANPSPVEFADKPLRLPSVGLTIQTPLNAQAQTDSAGRDSEMLIVPEDRSWSMKVKTPRSSDPATTIEQISDAALQVLFDSFGITQDAAKEAIASGKLIREPTPGQDLKVAGYDAERWFILLPSLKGGHSNVRGYTVIKTSPAQFVVFEFISTTRSYASARGIYQTVIGTTTIQDPALLQATRGAAIAAGTNLLDSIGTSAMQAIVEKFPQRWERRYKPGPNGDDASAKEIAYRRVRFLQGPRSMIQSADPRKTTTSGPDGFIVQVDARVITDKGVIADSRAAFFLSADATSEAWQLTNALRPTSGEKPQVATEIGARDGTSMVITGEAQGQAPTTNRPVMQGDGYISQVQVHLLPYLLMQGTSTADHGFYAWSSGEGKIVLRKDRIEPVTAQGAPAGWKLTTEVVEGKKPHEAYYDAAGSLLRIDLSDGSIWEPTTYEALKKIWDAKGLPTS